MIGLLAPVTADAFSNYLTRFHTKYGTSSTALNVCTVCHINTSGYARNDYGLAFQGVAGHGTAAGTAAALAAIEALDSDGDTYSNLVEIQQRTFPGNASSVPPAKLLTVSPAPTNGFVTAPGISCGTGGGGDCTQSYAHCCTGGDDRRRGGLQ
jgi:hypothetical protein